MANFDDNKLTLLHSIIKLPVRMSYLLSLILNFIFTINEGSL